ncbi:MAG: HlyD family efflux transporter periplasmic adaptor subunit [Cyanobacteria bacterium P01_F01_bin.150]
MFRWIAIGVVGLSSVSCSALSQAQSETAVEAQNVLADSPQDLSFSIDRVIALGRLQPEGEVIQLSVTNAEDSRVNQILVNEGDLVKAGQVIAILQGFERRQRDLAEAEKTVALFQAKLDQLRSGDAKASEIAAQESNIARLDAQKRNEILEREAAIAESQAALQQAKLTYERNLELVNDGAISQQSLDESKEALDRSRAGLEQRQAQLSLTIETLDARMQQEQKNLATLQEVRPVDIRVAQAELDRARIAVEQRQADLDDTQVKVPIAGQILRINTQVGEQVNTQEGIVELGQTNQMMAIAEVYETDILKIRSGQPAILVSEYGGFEGDVRGTVEHIGLQVGQRSLTDGANNPSTDENTRVVEVRIRIHPEDSPKVARLTNMQVRVEIDTSDTANDR